MNKKTVYEVLIIVLYIAGVSALYGDNGMNPEQKADLPEASEGAGSVPDSENTVSLMAGFSGKKGSEPIEDRLTEYGIERSDLDYYIKLNEEEKRYSGYKDDEEALLAKIILLKVINKSRQKYGTPPVELDILAGRAANRMALEAARNNFRGHWNMRGEKPYHRYADAGGLDHVAENASAYYSTAKINNSFRSCVNLMRESHKRFMAEKAPNDGHKKNVIKKTHNYVGLGFAVSGTQFRYYEEYIDRYLDIRTGPLKIKQGEEVFFKFKPLDDSEYPYAVFAYREAPLKEMTPAEINRKSSYPDYSREKSLKLWPWELEEADSEGYTAVRFKADKKGTYYIHIYLSREKYQSGKSASTRGKAIVSGIVFSAE